MPAIYRIPLETDLAFLDQKLKAREAAAVLKACVVSCHALAQGSGLTEDVLNTIMRALVHAESEVWGPAYAWVEPLLPRVAGLREAVQGLWREADDEVKLHLLHWRIWPEGELDDLDQDAEAEALGGLLRAESAELRFQALLLAHLALEGRWLRGPVACLRAAQSAESCPAVQTLMRVIMGSSRGASGSHLATDSVTGAGAADGVSAAPLKMSLDGLSGGRQAGAWLSFRFQPEVFLREQLERLSDFKEGYDRLPGQGRHRGWCAWWQPLHRLILAAHQQGEPVQDGLALRLLTADWQRVQARDYHAAHCPECRLDYAAAEMQHQDWQDGQPPLAMAGGFEIHCPARHRLFIERTWMS